MSKYSTTVIDSVISLKNAGYKHREISEIVFGKASSASSVHAILKTHHPQYTEQSTAPTPNLSKVVIIDIETTPIEGYFWGTFKQNIPIKFIKKDWYVLCFSYKELGKPIQNVSLRQFLEYASADDCELLLVEACWEVLDDADIIVAHNGRRFDKKKMNAKFLQYGLPEPSPYKVVDTLEIAKSNFALTSNKLDYIMRFLLDDYKMDTGGIDLWFGCMAGDHESWDTMESYCNKDVTGLEEVYLKLRGWDKRHPNVAMGLEDGKERCVVCGHHELELLDKNANTSVSSFQALRCKNCGHVNRRRKNIRSKEQMSSTLMNVQY